MILETEARLLVGGESVVPDLRHDVAPAFVDDVVLDRVLQRWDFLLAL